MIPYEMTVHLPSAHPSPLQQARLCLQSLEARLCTSSRTWRHVLSLTFFVDETEPAAYARRRERLLALASEFFDSDPPPVSVVAQAPEAPARVALEASVLLHPTASLTIARSTHRGVRYAVVSGRGIRQLHAGGIAAERDTTSDRARVALQLMEGILQRERMTFDHVVRQWNYIEDMLADEPLHGYQAFNAARGRAYEDATFPSGYPAATGIGQATGGVLLEFVAVDAPADVFVMPLSNPRQTDAHHYSAGVAPAAPRFERAKLVANGGGEMVFVSGTASIVGEESVHRDDLAAQTRTTIDNIRALLGNRGLSNLRAYVKRAEDIPRVRRICEASFGPIPALYVRADVCRDELLAELEGVARTRSSRTPARAAAGSSDA